MAYTTNPDGSITFRDPGNPVNGQMITIPAQQAQSMPASYWTQVTGSPEDKMATYQGLTNDADRIAYLKLPGNADLANTVRANMTGAQQYAAVQADYTDRGGQEADSNNNLALTPAQEAAANAAPSYSSGAYAPQQTGFGQSPNGPVLSSDPNNLKSATAGATPLVGTIGTTQTGTTAAGSAPSNPNDPNDIATQNQLRQTYMDSPLYNPNGANTYGIQNSNVNNLSQAFGGGVIDGGSNPYTVNTPAVGSNTPATPTTTPATPQTPAVAPGAWAPGTQTNSGVNQALQQMNLGIQSQNNPAGQITSGANQQTGQQITTPWDAANGGTPAAYSSVPMAPTRSTASPATLNIPTGTGAPPATTQPMNPTGVATTGGSSTFNEAPQRTTYPSYFTNPNQFMAR